MARNILKQLCNFVEVKSCQYKSVIIIDLYTCSVYIFRVEDELSKSDHLTTRSIC